MTTADPIAAAQPEATDRGVLLDPLDVLGRRQVPCNRLVLVSQRGNRTRP